jgi:hypothetical protein
VWINIQRRDYSNGTLDADRHGHARVPFVYTVDGYKLGWWVNMQRSNYTEGHPDAERARRLQELPGWTWKAWSST